MLYIVQIL